MEKILIVLLFFCFSSGCTKTDEKNISVHVHEIKVNFDDYIGKKVKTLIDDLSKYYEMDKRFKYFSSEADGNIMSNSFLIDKCSFLFDFSDDNYLNVLIQIKIDSTNISSKKIVIKDHSYYGIEKQVGLETFLDERIKDITFFFRNKEILNEDIRKAIERRNEFILNDNLPKRTQ